MRDKLSGQESKFISSSIMNFDDANLSSKFQNNELFAQFRSLYEDIAKPIFEKHFESFPEDDPYTLAKRLQIACLLTVVYEKDGISIEPRHVISRAVWSKLKEDVELDFDQLTEAPLEEIRKLSELLIPLELTIFRRSIGQPKESIFTQFHLEGRNLEEISISIGITSDQAESLFKEINEIIGLQGTISIESTTFEDLDKKQTNEPQKQSKITAHNKENSEEFELDNVEEFEADKKIFLEPANKSESTTSNSNRLRDQGDLSDISHLLLHKVLSREEEAATFRDLRKHREDWLDLVLRSPLIVARCIELYGELYKSISITSSNGQCEDSQSVIPVAKINKSFWIMEPDGVSQYRSNLLNDFPELEKIGEVLSSTALEETAKRALLIERSVEIMLRFPLHFSVINSYLEELRAYSDEMKTCDDDELLNEYLDEVGELGTDAEERLSLLENIKRNLQAATEHIVTHNQKLIYWAGKRYFWSVNSVLDFFQQGNIGLLKAIDYFDPELGLKFSTYAPYWIRQSITRYKMNNEGTIRVPVHARESINRAKKEYQADQTRTGDTRDFKDVAHRYLNSKNIVDYLNSYGDTPSSLSSSGSEDQDKLTLGDMVTYNEGQTESEGAFNFEVFHILTEHMCNELDEREQKILMARYGLETGDLGNERTLEEIGSLYKVTRERIRQIEKEAFRKIRQSLLSDNVFRALICDYFDIDSAGEDFNFEEYVRILLEGA